MISLILKNNNTQNGLLTLFFGQDNPAFRAENPLSSPGASYAAGAVVTISDDQALGARAMNDSGLFDILKAALNDGRLSGLDGTLTGDVLNYSTLLSSPGNPIPKPDSAKAVTDFVTKYKDYFMVAGIAVIAAAIITK